MSQQDRHRRATPRRTGPTPEQTEMRKALQRRGIALTPGLPGKKFTTQAGREVASTSPAVLNNFGPHDSTVGVLDESGPLAFDLDRNHEAGVDGVKIFLGLSTAKGIQIPRTLVIRTPRGGLHIYFQQPPGDPIGCSVGKLGPGIDVRGRGGLVVLPPTPGYSIKVDAPIRKLPPALYELMTAIPARATPTAPGGTTKHNLGGILSALNNAVEGERNQKLHWALRRVAEMPARRHRSALWNVSNVASGIGLPDWEIERTIASVFGGDRAELDEEVSTWKRIDLSTVVDGTFKALAPSVMRRADGQCLLYRGMVHSFHGESESGKSMVIQAEVAEALKAGKRVLYNDFESDPRTAVNRFLQMGVPPDHILKYLYYINPDTNPLDEDSGDNEHWELLLSRKFHLAVIDGVTEAFSVFGVSSMDNDDVTRWGREVPRRIAKRTGAAVVVIDHVNKDKESRGRFAMGAQSKMSYLTCASYVVEVIDPLGVGMLGRISLRVAKDRPGEVRPKSGPYRKGDRTQPTAVAVIDSTEPGQIKYSLEPFEETPTAGQGVVTDEVMLCVIEHLLQEKALTEKDPTRKHPSQNSIVEAVRQQGEWSVALVKKAIKQCDTEKLITISTREKQGKASTFTVTAIGKAYAESNRPEQPTQQMQ